VRKVDVHTHILPKHLPRWREAFGYGGFVQLEHRAPCCARMVKDDGTFFREVEDNCWSSERRIEQCDAAGVDLQVLSTVPVMFHYWAKPAHAHDTARFLNDHIAQVVADRPTRFTGLATLPLQSTDLSLSELQRVHDELRLPGVQIGTHVNGKNLDDPDLFPVFEQAARLGLCVFIHPWDMLGGARLARYWMPWLVGMPTELTIAICSLMFGGVLERLPTLRICRHLWPHRARIRGTSRSLRHAQPARAGQVSKAAVRRLAGARRAPAGIHHRHVRRRPCRAGY
jgi:aminocarboxymuconate-semialdehyde decarboxylase